MNQETIGQRLKILIKQLDLDVKGFCQRIDVSETSIRNYFSRGNNPNAEFLTKLTGTFEYVNLHWLLTGNGELFLSPPNENTQSITGSQKFFRSPIVGTNQGTAYQENSATSAASELEAVKTKLLLAEKEVEHLKKELATTNALLDSKNETITLLRIAFNRPN